MCMPALAMCMSNICTFRNRNKNTSFQPICNASHTKQKYKLVNKCDGITMTKSNKLILSLGNVCCANTHTHTQTNIKLKIERMLLPARGSQLD